VTGADANFEHRSYHCATLVSLVPGRHSTAQKRPPCFQQGCPAVRVQQHQGMSCRTGTATAGDALPYPGTATAGDALPYPGTVTPGDALTYPGTVTPGDALPYTGTVTPGDALPYTGTSFLVNYG
jgi:hypothetical protein